MSGVKHPGRLRVTTAETAEGDEFTVLYESERKVHEGEWVAAKSPIGEEVWQ